jgi:hypothetical protein
MLQEKKPTVGKFFGKSCCNYDDLRRKKVNSPLKDQ